MKSAYIVIGIFIGFLCIVCGVVYLYTNNTANTDVSHVSHNLCVHASTPLFYDEQLFVQGVRAVKSTDTTQKHIRGAIVPHHLLPSFIIADIFARIAHQSPQTIILIGPHHRGNGASHILTSACAWETPFGDVLPDTATVEELVARVPCVAYDKDAMDIEHAMGGMMPFIAYFMPDIQVIPIAIDGKATDDEMTQLYTYLAQKTKNDDAVVVASVDFSHYLSSQDAEKHDRETLYAMTDRDYGTILSYDDAHIDSPKSISILLSLMEHLHADDMHILHNTNSGRLIKNPYAQTTSYFGIVFD